MGSTDSALQAAALQPTPAQPTVPPLGLDDPALAPIVERVRAARAERRPLQLVGGGTKAFYGEAPQGEPLDLRGLAGISVYEPTELVVTVRAGTPLAELEPLP